MDIYPSWRYHPTEPARIVAHPGEEMELGDGWADTPAAFLGELDQSHAEPTQPAAKSRKPRKKA